MKIAYDYKIFSFQEYGGISRYYCRLIEALSNEEGVTPRVIAPMHINRYLCDLPSKLVAGMHVPRVRKTGKIRMAVNSVLSPVFLGSFQPNILHDTYYSGFPAKRRGMRFVSAVYDMIHEKYAGDFPDASAVTARKKAAVMAADHVICISEHTRKDLIDLFGVQPEKVSAVQLGFDKLSLPEDAGQEQILFAGRKPFLLYVGLRNGYKNFAGLLRAYAASKWLLTNFRLVCFGGGGLSAEEQLLISELGLDASQIEQVGGSDQLLALHYTNAAAFVYPSLYEGFGIPPLEAMALGCPVICSDTSSIPEVVGNAGSYFQPEDTESIRKAIEEVLQTPERRSALIALGTERCQQFSWERCARETLEIYRSLI